MFKCTCLKLRPIKLGINTYKAFLNEIDQNYKIIMFYGYFYSMLT